MATKIQIKRGTKTNLPALSPGEFGLTTDTEELYIGGNNGNIRMGKNGESSTPNATATHSGSVVAITAPAGVNLISFYAPSDFSGDDTYTVNGSAVTLTDLNGNAIYDGWKEGAPVQLILKGTQAFFKSGGGVNDTLPPLNPNFRLERLEGQNQVKISADKLLIGSDTDMLAGGVWVYKQSGVPQNPKDGTVKQWARADLVTAAVYDGLYLGDVNPSTEVAETILWLPETQGGATVLVPFLVLSADFKGGVYVLRRNAWQTSAWGTEASANAFYGGNTLDSLLNTTYVNTVLGESVAAELLETEIETTTSASPSAAVTIPRKAWQLSAAEMGLISGTSNVNFIVEGTALPYFNSNARRQVANDAGTSVEGWTRTTVNGSSQAVMLSTSGTLGVRAKNLNNAYARPAFVLPKDFKIQQRPDGSYTVWDERGLISFEDVEPSDASGAVMVNVTESGALTRMLYLAKEYQGTAGALMLREKCITPSQQMGTPRYENCAAANAVNQWASGTLDGVYSDYLIEMASLKYFSVPADQIYTTTTAVKGFILGVEALGYPTSEWGTEDPLPYFTNDARRVAYNDDGTNIPYWLRDIAGKGSNYLNWYDVNTAGSLANAMGPTNYGPRPASMFQLSSPIRGLADGSYDFVPNDPALSQTVSTLAEGDADSGETPLELTVPCQETDELYCRQFTYNEKKQYQTMLVGAVVSTGDVIIDPVFANNDWETIAYASEHGQIPDTWLVGDTKDFTLTGGETLTVEIVGFNHDDLADGSGKAGITFGLKNLMANIRQMNSSDTNAGGFTGSDMYDWLQGTLLNSLPSDLRAVLKSVNKKTSAGGQSSTINTNAMKIFLFSEIEIFGSVTHSKSGEGSQYSLFTTASKHIKRLSNGSGSANPWWERSPYGNEDIGFGYFCDVNRSGNADFSSANLSRGVCFGFCI